ncbi:helix-turn-helix domain-containing protein [Actinomadura barringtoniae]|uniref:Helix-turn-helix domain-containing protein n=1 Tax=Actinomadura barringtoniae TaxID=1427535 RepID=A0A939PAR4_9ACTN|nr:helix-turn-helix transcriptional regulator [Actinomadura barringtoniae]MBO2448712.1 helix-turn-helix domain-containing protein [Actinomadura barringtoniae]
MAARKPTPQTRAFGEQVTRLRTETGLTRLALAEQTAVSRSYVAQVERGVTKCRRDYAVRLDSALKSGTVLADLWDRSLARSNYPAFFASYPQAEATASLLRAWEATYVFGLVQTEDYIRAQGVSINTFDGRMRRQSVLERETPPTIAVVLSASVLLRCVGSPEVMRAQCESLIAFSERDNVVLQVAPVAYYRGISGSFNLATQEDGKDLLFLETTVGGVTSNDPAEILHIQKVFPALQARSLNPEASRDHIRKVISETWT